jgi:hypothetical protein
MFGVLITVYALLAPLLRLCRVTTQPHIRVRVLYGAQSSNVQVTKQPHIRVRVLYGAQSSNVQTISSY